ncbi:MAG: hypothetical protein AAF385_14990 [Pseudomonadota bacterium]
MKSNDYLWPGIASIVVAVGMPFYWLVLAGAADLSDYTHRLPEGPQLADLVFVALGILMIYVYMSLRRILHDHYNYHGADLPITLLIITCALFHVGTLLLDYVGGQLIPDSFALAAGLLWVFFVVLFGVLDIVLAIMLLKDRTQLSDLFFAFAIINLVMGIFELTIIFSFTSLVLYPLTLLILTVAFLRRPREIEFV